MPLAPDAIVTNYVFSEDSIERIAHRTRKERITIVEPNPAWFQRFADTKARIQAALGSTAAGIYHAGSTSVPGLPAKDVIDVDLVVNSIQDEDSYVPALEQVGFRFLLREPAWHQHRFFVDEGDRPASYHVNLHVFEPNCPEVARHQIFREWLMKCPADLELYATTKRECAAASDAAGETMQKYNERKEMVIQTILGRAFRDLGYIK